MPDSDEMGILVDEFARMLDAHLPTGSNAADALDEPGKIWSAVVSGGWLELSEHTEPDQPAMHIRDVARFCLAWGRRLVPLP